MIATVHPENNASQRILTHVLKNKEATIYNSEYQGAPRLLFFKPFNDNKKRSDKVIHQRELYPYSLNSPD